MQNNPYQNYNENKILNASKPELTLMLYEGSIKFLNTANMAIEKGDIQKAHENIMKTEKIIDYLRQTLNMEYDIAQDFENMYSYIANRLIDANIGKDKEILDEINAHMHAIRDNWLEVMKANKVAD